MTLSKLVKELGFAADVHGFRTSFRTWAQERTNFPREVCEQVLAHVTGDAAERAYARSDVLVQRRKLDGCVGHVSLDEMRRGRCRYGPGSDPVGRKKQTPAPALGDPVNLATPFLQTTLSSAERLATMLPRIVDQEAFRNDLLRLSYWLSLDLYDPPASSQR